MRGVDDEDDEEREETSAPTQPTVKQREKEIQDGVTDGDNARQTCTGEGRTEDGRTRGQEVTNSEGRGCFGERRSSNYYGFSGSNSPDGNTTQFTHADCAREDVNSCQSDGPFHLLFFVGF